MEKLNILALIEKDKNFVITEALEKINEIVEWINATPKP